MQTKRLRRLVIYCVLQHSNNEKYEDILEHIFDFHARNLMAVFKMAMQATVNKIKSLIIVHSKN